MGKRSRAKRREQRQARADSLVNVPDLTGDVVRSARADGWENLITMVGTSRDKRGATQAGAPVDLTQDQCEALYHGNDTAHRICRVPAEIMTRAWVRLKVDGDPEADGEARADLIRYTHRHLETLRAKKRFCEALTAARKTGGSIIFIGADTGTNDDPALELDVSRVRAVRFLTVFDRFEVKIGEWDRDPVSPTYGEPLYYIVGNGTRIHASRVLRFDGTDTSRMRRRHNGGWCDSVFVRMFEALRGYGATWDAVEVLMQDFAQMIVKLKGLAEAMATGGEAAIKGRLELMDLSRSVMNALVMDAEHEEAKREATPTAGLPELLTQWMYRLASAAEMPMTLLFGTSPGGLNATGESDTRNWYDTVSAWQEAQLGPQVERLFEIVLAAREGPSGGRPPESWHYEFVPLWQMSEREKAELHKIQAEADAQYIELGVVTEGEVAASRFAGDEYSTDTRLDLKARSLLERTEAAEEAVRQEAAAKAEALKAKGEGLADGGDPSDGA